MVCPVEGGRHKRGYFPTNNRQNPNRHYGVDIAVAQGSAVSATASGTVVRASDHPVYGNVVVVDHGVNASGNHVYTLYAHLSQLNVSLNQTILVGDTIGQSGGAPGTPGAGSVSDGPHLHYEVIETGSALSWNPTGSMGPTGTIGRVDPYGFNDWPAGSGGDTLCLQKPLDPAALDNLLWLQKAFEARQQGSPIVLDLDGDGIETRGLDGLAYFDHDSSGFIRASGWVGADDGLLVRDLDEDGIISSGRELFGNETPLLDGTKASNGFDVLVELDENADGRVDALDSSWSTLRVWQDVDGDGHSTADELFTLSSLEVASVSVGYTNSTYVDPEGNAHKQVGSYTRSDGSTGDAVDVWFSVDRSDSIATTWLTVPPNIGNLPEIEGSGNLYSLHQAMVRDSTGALQQQVETFVNEPSAGGRASALEEILLLWTDSNSVAVDARGTAIDARKVHVLEQFAGEPWQYATELGLGSEILYQAAATLAQGYGILSERVYAQLVASTHLQPYFDLVQTQWDGVSSTVRIDTTQSIAALDALELQDPIVGAETKAEFARVLASLFVPEDIFGESQVSGSSSDDSIVTVAPASTITAGGGNDSVQLNAELSLNVVYAGDGNDSVVVNAENAPLVAYGEAGDDVLTGSNAPDVMYGGPGVDTISGGAGNDQLAGEDGDDLVSGNEGDDLLLGGLGNDTLYGGVGADLIYGGDGINSLSGGDGNDWLVGGAEYDEIYGESGDDHISDPGGDGLVEGGEGADVVDIATLWWGTYTVSGGAGADVIRVVGNNYPMSFLTQTISGGAGNDVIYGSNSAEVLLFDRGDGADTFNDWGGTGEKIQFGTGIAVGDVTAQRSGTDMVIRIADPANPTADDRITVTNWYGGKKVETLQFQSGSTMTAAQVEGMASIVVGTEGNDTLTGYLANETFYGLGGDDNIQSGSGNDVVYGGAGNDTISDSYGDDLIYGEDGNDTISVAVTSWGSNVVYGGAGADVITVVNNSYPMSFLTHTLSGGPGNDTINGSNSAEVLLFGRGDGADTFNDWGGTGEKIQFGAGIAVGDVTARRSGTDMVIRVTDPGDPTADDRITVTNWYGGKKVETIQFQGGSTLSPAQVEAMALVVTGTEGNDSLTGYETNETFYGLGGDDNITTGGGNNVVFGGDGADTITVTPGPSPWTTQSLYGGKGDDTLTGGYGYNHYYYNRGDGGDTILDYANGWVADDKIVFGGGIGLSDVTARREGNAMVFGIADPQNPSSNDRITVQNWFVNGFYWIERLEFLDGTVVLGSQIVVGDANGNTLSGTSSANLIDGNAGNDTISGGAGNDALRGGSGDDTVNGDDGDDLVYGDAGSDSLGGGNGNDYVYGGVGNDVATGGAGTDVLQGGDGDDNVQGGIGNDLVVGDIGNDVLDGGDGNDLLAGGSGNDTINTGSGNNIIAYNAGGGIDTVIAPAGSVNTLSFGGGIGYDDLSLSKSGNDLVVSAGVNDQVVLKDWYAGSQSVLNLQIILDATAEFDANSSDPLYNRKVQTFDFAGLVAEFDNALAQSPGLTSWAVTNALLQFHLSGSDGAAIGGDLAYWYGKNNGFTGISLQAAQQVLGGVGFGSDAQTLQPFSGLQEGYVKLA